MKKKIFFSVIVLIFFFSCSPKPDIEYEFVKVGRGNIKPAAITTGVLVPTRIAEVGSQVSGKIAKIYVDFNDAVKKDQVLAELNQEQFLAKIDQINVQISNIKITLDLAEKNLETWGNRQERAKALFEKSLISREELENTELQFQTAEAQVKLKKGDLKQAESQFNSAQIDLNYTVIKSPIDGIVIQRKVEVGEAVSAGFQIPILFKIAADLSNMEIRANIKEADVGKIKEGQKVVFTCLAFPEQDFYGIVVRLQYNPQIVEGSVAYPAIIRVKNSEKKFRPDMTASIVSVAEAKGVLIVPNDALNFRPSKTSGSGMWIKDNNSIRWVAVKIGERDDNFTEIKEGLKGGELIVVKEKSGGR